MPSSNSIEQNPPPTYEDIRPFTRDHAPTAEAHHEAGAEQSALVPAGENDEPLVQLAATTSLIRLAYGDSGGEAAEDVRSVFGQADCRHLVDHIAKHPRIFRAQLPSDPTERSGLLRDMGRALQSGVEPRRRDTLLRLFLDQAADANFNPMQLIDKEKKPKGNLLQVFHPVAVNIILVMVGVVAVLLGGAILERR